MTQIEAALWSIGIAMAVYLVAVGVAQYIAGAQRREERYQAQLWHTSRRLRQIARHLPHGDPLLELIEEELPKIERKLR